MSALPNYSAPRSYTPPLDRLTSSALALKDKAMNTRAAAKVRRGAEAAYSQARKHPTSLLVGAAAVGVLAALLMNRKTRTAGMDLAQRAWNLRHR